MSWAHRSGTEDHPVDPHYNGNGKPAWWTCHTKVGKDQCDGELLLDGRKVPLTVPLARATDPAEPPLSSQP